MKKLVKVFISENKKICKDVYFLSLKIPESYPESIPGQFVNLYLNNESKILPRPISIFHRCSDEIHLLYAVVGKGTKELSNYKKGSNITITTPLGNGYRLPDFSVSNLKNNNDNHILLAGGGLGIAPLHYLASYIYNKYRISDLSPKIYAVLGYKDIPFLSHKFNKYCCEVQVCSEKNNIAKWSGTIMVPITNLNYHTIKKWYSCGPAPMQKALTNYVSDYGINDFQVSLEERMGCGFGTCVGCTVDIRETMDNTIIRKKVCSDGPVFLGSEVVWK